MAEIDDLNVTDASNIGRFPENMPPAAVNNGARALEGLIARWVQHSSGENLVAVTETGVNSLSVSLARSSFSNSTTASKYINGLTMLVDIPSTITDVPLMGINGHTKYVIVGADGTSLSSSAIIAGMKGLFSFDPDALSGAGAWQMLNPPAKNNFASLFVNENANADMTTGLTINQGAADDEALALKSSDVAHAMTGVAEADTFGAFTKVEATSGGLQVSGLKDADGAAGLALVLVGRLGEAADTTDITTSDACVHIQGQVTDGGTGVTGAAATGNILVIENDSTVRLLVKGNGVLHATNITAGSGDLDGVALDGEDDIGLVRVFERTVHKGLGIAMSKWDEGIKNNEDDLKRLGVLSSQGDFYNMQRMNSLLGGAIWQLNVMLKETQERLAVAERRLAVLPVK